MARKRKKEISPQKLREILRLGIKHQLGNREIARSCSVSHVTVGAYLRQVKDQNLTWSDIEDLDESKLRQLVQGAHSIDSKKTKPEPDWEYIHKELRKKRGYPATLMGRIQRGASCWVSVNPVW